MSASITLFPTPHTDLCVMRWAREMQRRGYEVCLRRLANGMYVTEAWPCDGDLLERLARACARPRRHRPRPGPHGDGPSAA